MAFCFASAQVWDDKEKHSFLRGNISDLAEIKSLVNMNRSHKKNGRPRDYKYTVAVARDNYRLYLKYEGSRKVAVMATAEEPFNIGIFAKPFYERETGSFRLTKLDLVHKVDVYADPCEDAAYTAQLTGLVQMFHVVHDIVPVIIGKDIAVHCSVGINLDDPTELKTIARCKAVAMKRLTDFNLLARL
jgi:hypothetical protein